MNGFKRHGIVHCSASQLNKWNACQGAWVAHYLFKQRVGSVSAAMYRGICSEEGVKSVITKECNVEQAILKAQELFDQKMMFDDGSSGKERENIDPMIRLAVEALEPYGEPEFTKGEQQQVSMDIEGDGWSLPFVGYLDFVFPEHGLIIDLKTTLRMPTTMSKPHQLQRGFYAAARGNQDVRFLYVTPKKAEIKSDGDPSTIMQEIKTTMARQERFLSLGDRDFLKSVAHVTADSYYWRGGERIRAEMFGL